MLFLIEYDRKLGEIVSHQAYTDAQRGRAINARLDLELQLGEKLRVREVVLLEAENEEALRLTHRRFFEDLAGLMRTPSGDNLAVG